MLMNIIINYNNLSSRNTIIIVSIMYELSQCCSIRFPAIASNIVTKLNMKFFRQDLVVNIVDLGQLYHREGWLNWFKKKRCIIVISVYRAVQVIQ